MIEHTHTILSSLRPFRGNFYPPLGASNNNTPLHYSTTLRYNIVNEPDFYYLFSAW